VSRVDAVLAEEARLDPALLARAVAERAVLDLRALGPEAEAMPDLEVDAMPEGAVVLDLRSKTAYAAWHWPGALRLDLDHALYAYRSFAREGRYVVYCEFGLKSAHLAERMRAEGLEAWHFRGGLKALVAHARSRGRPGPELI
jgi:thiamine biosynthesis protein ThiI